MKKYNIIYADPPWNYKDKALAGNRGAGCKYNVMSTEDIKKLPVKEFAAEDYMLFIWVTMPKLNEVFDLIEHWGFTYETCGFNWENYRDWETDRKSTRLNSSHSAKSRMPSSA